jgi:Dual specificity phosphatase, catalytic domain
MKRKVKIPTLRKAQGEILRLVQGKVAREEYEGSCAQTAEVDTPTLSHKTRQGWGTWTKAERSYRTMDITWLDEDGRIGVGGGIWNVANMAKVAKEGITHIIDMQIECDDRKLGPEEYGIEVLWNPTDDDFLPKDPELFQAGVDFVKEAFAERTDAKVFIHCAAGVHRAPMMALAVLCTIREMNLNDAKHLIEDKRPAADFAEVYVESVARFLRDRKRGETSSGGRWMSPFR